MSQAEYQESLAYRQRLIDAIERLAGTLATLDYSKMSTGDLMKLCDAVESIWSGEN